MVQHEIKGDKGEFLPVELVADDNVLLIADSKGFITGQPWPTTFPVNDPGLFEAIGEKCRLHAHQISYLCVSADGSVLITASLDGAIMFSMMTHIVQGHARDVDMPKASPTQVLIDPEDIAMYKTKMRDLAIQISSARTQAEYNVRHCASLAQPVQAVHSDRQIISAQLQIQ